jgi:hypothetical protein
MLNSSLILRIVITFALIFLLVTSIVSLKKIVTSTWQGQQRDDALYNKSPNCGGPSDSSNIDTSLPPCQNTTASVIAKPQYTTVDHRRYRDYVKAHRQLTLQFSNGRTQTVGDIYEDMWNSITLGEHISVVIWRGQVMAVNANGDSSPITDPKEWNGFEASLIRWGILAIVCVAGLSLLWRANRRRMVPF